MTARETLEAWSAETTAEIVELSKERDTERESLSAAEAAYGAAEREWKELRDLVLRGIGHDEETTLGMRLQKARAEILKQASSAVAIARARLEAIDGRIDGRQLILRQIAAALAPPEQGTVLGEVIKLPKPPPVEFDDVLIVMPQKAATAP